MEMYVQLSSIKSGPPDLEKWRAFCDRAFSAKIQVSVRFATRNTDAKGNANVEPSITNN